MKQVGCGRAFGWGHQQISAGMSVFEQRFDGLGRWQDGLSDALGQFAEWLRSNEHLDDIGAGRLRRLRERLARREVSLAFVAEFSRGKSELINALFFARYGQRIVPSSAGRTTMCPTELRWDADLAHAIRLLPIATRDDERTLDAWRGEPDAWAVRSFDPQDVASLKSAFAAVAETEEVSAERARSLGLLDDETIADGASVEIPRWRHAIVNVEHPLLAAGLCIIDTPGLNAIGSEPMLTLNTIPNADAVLFLLAADAGVTRSDIDVWQRYISPSHRSGRLVVLNKVDGLWDELKSEDQIDAEIGSQIDRVAQTLSVGRERIFAVSAQKGLVARVHHDEPLLRRSGIEVLERALADAIIPQRQTLLAEHVEREIRELSSVTGELLRQRIGGAELEYDELDGLRGKNRDIMTHMATRIRIERDEFDRSLRQLNGLRAVFARHSAALHSVTGVDRLKRHARESRDMMGASRLSLGLSDGMAHLFRKVEADMASADEIVREIGAMMGAMYRTFSQDHGLKLGAPLNFSMKRFRAEVAEIQALFRAQFGAMSMMTTEKWSLMRRFFEMIVLRVREVYRLAGGEINAWLKSVMAPVEAQVREFQRQLKRRLESVRRVLEANEGLEERLRDVERDRDHARAEMAAFESLLARVRRCQAGEYEPAHGAAARTEVALMV
ncbi:MAG: dynamin family protein [Burkholderiaceae bacterium]